MKPRQYPFAAIAGQSQMKLALLLAAVDWRLGVLLRGDKGAGKTTAGRALAALLPSPAPFINLPIGTTEDRLLGGLHLERALQGQPVVKPGLLSEAHGGVLYIDEINLLAGHLGDALLDAAASGVHFLEREGFTASYETEFVLLGSMNPEEGSLRPQLLDRFALCVDVIAPAAATERQTIVQRRLAFEQNAQSFLSEWSVEQEDLKNKIVSARISVARVQCSDEMLAEISERVCQAGVTSLRADLAVMRAATAYAALCGENAVTLDYILAVFPLVVNHRRQHAPKQRQQTSAPAPPQQTNLPEMSAMERVFTPKEIETAAIQEKAEEIRKSGSRGSSSPSDKRGTVVGSRRSETPAELDLRATISSSLRENGKFQLTSSSLHEHIRVPRTGIRYLLVVDSSGSHAANQRMRLVKGAAAGLLSRSFKRGDEVAMIAFRGTRAEVIVEPTQVLSDALTAVEYLPTGGRTPLAHALERASEYVDASTILILLTDGRANVPLHGGDPAEEALEIASALQCSAIVVDTAEVSQEAELTRKVADALRARYLTFDQLASIDVLSV